MTKDEALRMALEALKLSDTVFYPQTSIAIAAIEGVLAQPEQEPVEDLQAKLKWATERLEANINWEVVAFAKEEMLKAAWAEIKELRQEPKIHIESGMTADELWLSNGKLRADLADLKAKKALAQPEQEKERCVGCEACIDTACGRDECPKGWPKAAQPEQEPVAWRNAAIRVGEDLCSVGPFGYYDMNAEQWLDWALSVVTVHAPPPQRTWVELPVVTLPLEIK